MFLFCGAGRRSNPAPPIVVAECMFKYLLCTSAVASFAPKALRGVLPTQEGGGLGQGHPTSSIKRVRIDMALRPRGENKEGTVRSEIQKFHVVQATPPPPSVFCLLGIFFRSPPPSLSLSLSLSSAASVYCG